MQISAQTSGANVKLTQMSVNATYWAVTDISGCSGGRWPSTRNITLNDATMYSLTTFQKRIVIQHEFGHAVGLAHPSGTFSCSSPSMMFQGTGKFGCSTEPIWNDDMYVVNAIYASA